MTNEYAPLNWFEYRKKYPAYQTPPGQEVGLYAARVFNIKIKVPFEKFPHQEKLQQNSDGCWEGTLDEDEIDDIYNHYPPTDKVLP